MTTPPSLLKLSQGGNKQVTLDKLVLWKGSKLTSTEGKSDKKNGVDIQNNEFFVVVKWCNRYVHICPPEEPDKTMKLTRACIQNKFRAGYADTVHRYQGHTIRGKYRIWDSEVRYVTPAWLYVAVSRGTSWANISVSFLRAEQAPLDAKWRKQLVGPWKKPARIGTCMR